MDKDQFDGIIVLKVIAEKKSFTEAAEIFSVSPAAISKIISQLEKKMQVPLLTRTTRSVDLTEAGKIFLEQAGSAIDKIMFAQESAKSFAKKPSGLLRINMPKDVYHIYLSPLITSFLEKYPDITMDICLEDNSSNIFKNGFDAGVRYFDVLDKDVTALKISNEIRWVTVASLDYLKKYGEPKHPKDLLNHNCIRQRWGSNTGIYDHWEFVEKDKEFSVFINGSLILNDSLQIVQSTEEGVGIAYVDYNVIKEKVNQKRLKIILEEYHTISNGYYLYYTKRSQVLPKLRAFINHIKSKK